MPQLSPNILTVAKQMRSEGVPWKKIGYALGIGEYRIRCELEPGYRQRCCDKVKRMRGGFAPRPARPVRAPRIKKSSFPRPAHMGGPEIKATGNFVGPVRAPPEAIADRDRRAELEHATLTAALLGDPLPGLSALDRRK